MHAAAAARRVRQCDEKLQWARLPWIYDSPRMQDLGVDVTPRLKTLQVEEPPKRKGGVILGSVAELVDRLRNEAKVI